MQDTHKGGKRMVGMQPIVLVQQEQVIALAFVQGCIPVPGTAKRGLVVKIMDVQLICVRCNSLFYIFVGRIIRNYNFHVFVILLDDRLKTANHILWLFIRGNTNTYKWLNHDKDGDKYNQRGL